MPWTRERVTAEVLVLPGVILGKVVEEEEEEFREVLGRFEFKLASS